MFSPGLRISIIDVCVLIAGVIGAVVVGFQVFWAGAVIGFVVGHFFLFCNVFRISRKPELIWAAVFILLSGSTMLNEWPAWIVTFSMSFVVALVLIFLETKKPSYHGIGWKHFNPNLQEWWERRFS